MILDIKFINNTCVESEMKSYKMSTLVPILTLSYLFILAAATSIDYEGSYRNDIVVTPRSSVMIDCATYPENASNSNEIIWIINVDSRLSFNISTLTKSKDDRLSLQSNGSLLIDNVGKYDTGSYVCTYGSNSSLVVITLDYAFMATIEVHSLFVGFMSAIGFFLIAVILAVIRYFAHICSKEERVKRRSFREVLSVIRSSSHMDKLSAYKAVKFDQFSTFTTATMDQFSAFRTAKVDKLRTYKHATVIGMQQYLERMRDYYSVQTDKLKKNCASRSRRLRRNYAVQKRRFSGQTSTQMKNIIENYQARRLHIKRYGASQMNRLREQYKTQQQHVLKLLELLDIGNCVNIIRDDCQRTESAIFDNINFEDVATADLHCDKLLENDEDDDDDELFCSDNGDLDNNDDIPPLKSGLLHNDEDDDDDYNLDEDDNEESRFNLTIDDVLGDIAARVDMIRSESANGALGFRDPDSDSDREEPRGARARVVSLTISLKDLHENKMFGDPFDSAPSTSRYNPARNIHDRRRSCEVEPNLDENLERNNVGLSNHQVSAGEIDKKKKSVAGSTDKMSQSLQSHRNSDKNKEEKEVKEEPDEKSILLETSF